MSKIYLTSSLLSPLHFVYAIAKHDDIKVIPNPTLVFGEWGIPVFEDYFLEVNTPVEVELVWFSFYEKSFYEFKCTLDAKLVRSSNVLIGCTLFGNVSLWAYDSKKSTLIRSCKGNCIDDKIQNVFDIENYQITLCGTNITIYQICQRFDQKMGKELLDVILANKGKFDKLVTQYTYHYLTLFEKWNTDEEKWTKYEEEDILPEFDYIEEMLYDGTHDKLHDGGLMKYHEAGKPKKLALKWHIRKSEYSAYFWFDEDGIRAVFDKFYGAHPDTKTDFIIHIDPENRKYELSLYRYGLKQPQIIPESAYQLIVFKNQFEDYRSDNYNQQRGAWIW